jgi:hypothetical protein
MNFTLLLNEIQMEVIVRIEIEDLINFCHTIYPYKNHIIIKKRILSKINTNYILDDFTVDQLFLFYKTNKLNKQLLVRNGFIIIQDNNHMRLHDYVANQTYDFGFIVDLSTIYQMNIDFLTIHGEILTDPLSGIKLLDGLYKHPTIKLDFNTIDHRIVINAAGECYCYDRKILIKNVIKKAGCFILDVHGNVYIELNNGYIYNPMTEKKVNFNRYFDWSPFTTYKYYALQVQNVKDVTIYGDMLTNDGFVYRFDWNTLDVNLIKHTNITQIVNLYYHNTLHLLFLYDQSVYFNNVNISKDYKITEMHIDSLHLICYTADREILWFKLLTNEINKIDN